MKTKLMALGLGLILAQSTLANAKKALPVCDKTLFHGKVGTSCEAGFDTIKILHTVQHESADYEKLTADGRSLSSVVLQVLKPRGKHYSPTYRYIFTAHSCSFERCFSSARWVVDTYMDMRIADHIPTNYESHGVRVRNR